MSALGTAVETVPTLGESDAIYSLLESGQINYVIYTGALRDDTIDDYIALHRKAVLLGVAYVLLTARPLSGGIFRIPGDVSTMGTIPF